MLNGIHGHQDIERVVYGRPTGPALRAEAERLGARRVFVTTTRSVAQSALLADVIRELGDRYAGVYAGITAHSPRPWIVLVTAAVWKKCFRVGHRCIDRTPCIGESPDLDQ